VVEIEILEEVRVSVRRSCEIGVLKHGEEQALGRVPNATLSIEANFGPAPKMKVFSATLVVSGVYLFQGIGVSQLHSGQWFHVSPCSVAFRNLKIALVSLLELRM
jgi:hypothetical protein